VKSARRPPERGDIVWIDFSPQVGHEQAGRRPALVISPGAYNRRLGLAIVCPVTSRSKGFPWEVALPAGLPAQGVVLSDQARSLDWVARRSQRICAAPEAVTFEVLDKLDALLK
jgi:mRNA interferase MazF